MENGFSCHPLLKVYSIKRDPVDISKLTVPGMMSAFVLA